MSQEKRKTIVLPKVSTSVKIIIPIVVINFVLVMIFTVPRRSEMIDGAAGRFARELVDRLELEPEEEAYIKIKQGAMMDLEHFDYENHVFYSTLRNKNGRLVSLGLPFGKRIKSSFFLGEIDRIIDSIKVSVLSSRTPFQSGLLLPSPVFRSRLHSDYTASFV